MRAAKNLRADAWAVFGRRCGVGFAEVADYGVELLSVDEALDVVIMCDARGVACIVWYDAESMRGVYARAVVGELAVA